MDQDQTIERAARRWLYGAGIVAIIFVILLKTADDRLSSSTREAELGATLHTLRSAQFSLASRVTDTRQIGAPAVKQEEPAPAVESEPPAEK